MNKTLRTAMAVGATVAVPALANALIRARSQTAANTLGGEEHYFSWRQGDIFYTTAGEGSPLLLVHGIGAGNSSYEWQHNFLPLSESFRVYALDLLGFGLSDRPRLAYRGRIYVDLLHDFVEQVICEPANAIASSLSAAYLVETAALIPESFLRLMLVSPCGVTRLNTPPGLAGKVAAFALRAPVWGQTAYNMITSRRAIGHQLRDTFYANPESVSEPMIRHYHRSSHQRGAREVVAAFIGGYLNLDARESFAALDLPLKLVWGQEARYCPVDDAPAWLELNPRAELTVIEEAGEMPHAEQPLLFNAVVQEQLRGR